MPLVRYLLLSSMVLGAQLSLYPTQQFLFVEISATAKIPCSSKEKLEGGGISVYWYRRREGEGPTCIKKCLNDQNVSKFACKPETHGMTLEIYNVQQNESGDYYCAVKTSSYLIFGNGSTLIVGDSYTTGSWVLLLAPSLPGLISTGTVDLACIIHGVSNPVQISWNISGDWQEQALMRSLKAKDGSLMLISHISIPKDAWTSAKILTCEVKFNSSGTSVKKSARYIERFDNGCFQYAVPLAVGGALVLLMVSLSLVWICCPSTRGFQACSSASPAPEEHQDGLVYCQLDFDSRQRGRSTMERPARGKSEKS
ncbi:immunoglobulin kappa light chain-like [Terrapene carolina triunguis]|uniref:immunoglobulin kappa light chain-like n=1 Tax=Terrapene triunguis TaxID=2587831 RepID=UPI000E7764A8|nr:immunoglobulin kappa light chain-like [Terrapene carolina triunguis]